MTDNEFLLKDRLQKIRQIIKEYDEGSFYISFSGGRDSCVVSALVDLAIPGNGIPRVYADTGIEYQLIKDFVQKRSKEDKRIVIIEPNTPIKKMLEEEGYPFKSKSHSQMVARFNKIGKTKSVIKYLGEDEEGEKWSRQNRCPVKLRYQFTEEFDLKVSDKCCTRLKEDPLKFWAIKHRKEIAITGLMREEGGRRRNAQCLAYYSGRVVRFNPLAVISKEWEEWFINKYKVEICEIYKEPYNFLRTGCKGCPFALKLQEELNTLAEYFPKERLQCERIWAPVYKEYRRLRYRIVPLDKEEERIYLKKGVKVNGKKVHKKTLKKEKKTEGTT